MHAKVAVWWIRGRHRPIPYTVEFAAHKHFRFRTAALGHFQGDGIQPLLAALFALDAGLRDCHLRLQASEREGCLLRTYGQQEKPRS
jgi:hypothetical protein